MIIRIGLFSTEEVFGKIEYFYSLFLMYYMRIVLRLSTFSAVCSVNTE